MNFDFSYFRNKRATTFITAALVTAIILVPCIPSASGSLSPISGTIADLALQINGLQALVGALIYVDDEANLIALLSDNSQRLTVFGPTNAAFELALGLEPGALDGLSPQDIADSGLLPPVDVVLAVLLKHVIVGELISETSLLLKGDADAADGTTELVFSVGPSPIAMNGGVRVNNATIVLSDIRARNGYLHIIDEVIQ